MYTGIVQAVCHVKTVVKKTGLNSLVVVLPDSLLVDLTIGASVGLDGVCLTVTAINDDCISFDVMQETLAVTTLGTLNAGSLVNVERSAKQGVEIGGHLLSGHVDTQAVIVLINLSENNCEIVYKIQPEFMPYLFKKGFVALNGCSLTIASVSKEDSTLTVFFIPETLRVTTHSNKKMGDNVNVEVDRQTQVIVDTVRAFLQENATSIFGL